MTALVCTRCGKKLSRKHARMIDGKPMHAGCMFGNKRDSGSGSSERRHEVAPAEGPQSGGEAASPNPSQETTPND